MYLLKKWYFDCLTRKGEYAYVCFAYMALAGRTIRSLTLHVAAPGAIPVSRSFLIRSHSEAGADIAACAIGLPCGDIRVGARDCSLFLASDDCAANLAFSNGNGEPDAPVQIVTGRKSRIVWRPVALRYDVNGEITLGGTRLEPRGASGYADVLQSTCLPPLVPARTLYWGRAHHASFDMTYVHALTPRGESVCSRLYVRTGNTALGGPLSFAPDGGGAGSSPGGYVIAGTAGECRLSARVHHERPVQESSFVDQQDVPQTLRGLMRLLTRDPRGTKYLARAHVSLLLPGEERSVPGLAMIDECVRL